MNGSALPRTSSWRQFGPAQGLGLLDDRLGRLLLLVGGVAVTAEGAADEGGAETAGEEDLAKVGALGGRFAGATVGP